MNNVFGKNLQLPLILHIGSPYRLVWEKLHVVVTGKTTEHDSRAANSGLTRKNNQFMDIYFVCLLCGWDLGWVPGRRGNPE